MNWDRVEGNWNQFTGKLQQRWGKLTDDDLQQVKGSRTDYEVVCNNATVTQRTRRSERLILG
jgi:CsbD-like